MTQNDTKASAGASPPTRGMSLLSRLLTGERLTDRADAGADKADQDHGSARSAPHEEAGAVHAGILGDLLDGDVPQPSPEVAPAIHAPEPGAILVDATADAVAGAAAAATVATPAPDRDDGAPEAASPVEAAHQEPAAPTADAGAASTPAQTSPPAPRPRRKRTPSWITPAPHHARDKIQAQRVVIPKGTSPLRQALARHIESLPPDRAWEVAVREFTPLHTDDQRGYLWGVVYKTIADFTGHDVNDLHEIYLGMFFGETEIDIFGVKRRKPMRRSSVMDTRVYFDYTDFIRSHALNTLGCFVPDPQPDVEARMRERLHREVDAEIRARARGTFREQGAECDDLETGAMTGEAASGETEPAATGADHGQKSVHPSRRVHEEADGLPPPVDDGNDRPWDLAAF